MLKRILLILLTIMMVLIFFLGGIYWFNPGWYLSTGRKMIRFMAGMEDHHIMIDGEGWAYLDNHRKDKEVLILIHGFGADKDHWGRWLLDITDHYHVIIPDLPGFGESGHERTKKYSINLQKERLAAFMKHLALKEKYHILGNSMGGAIAGAYAVEHQSELRSLILVDNYGIKSNVMSDAMKMYQKDPQNNNLFLFESPETFDALMRYVFYKPLYVPYRIKKALAEHQAKHNDLYGKIFKEIQSEGDDFLASGLKTFKKPLLVIWGENDGIFHHTTVDRIKELVPECETAIIPKSGHVPYVETPDQFHAIITPFLEKY